MEIIFKAISFVLWLLVGIFILPLVFIVTIVFPKWEKWGENF